MARRVENLFNVSVGFVNKKHATKAPNKEIKAPNEEMIHTNVKEKPAGGSKEMIHTNVKETQILETAGGSQKNMLDRSFCERNIDPKREPILLCSFKEDKPAFVQKLKEALQNAGHYVPLLVEMDDYNFAAELFECHIYMGVLWVVVLSDQCLTSKCALLFLLRLRQANFRVLPLFSTTFLWDEPLSVLEEYRWLWKQRGVVNFHMHEDDLFIKDVLFHVSILRGRDLAAGNEPITKEIDKIFQIMLPATKAPVLGLYGSVAQGKPTACELMVNSYAQTYRGKCALIDFSRSTDCNAKEMAIQYNKALHRFGTSVSSARSTFINPESQYSFKEVTTYN